MNISVFSKIKKFLKALLDKYSIAARYLFLLICGFAASLIFGALAGYTYSEKTTSLALFSISSPFAACNGLYDAFGKLISYSLIDTVFLATVFIAGLTCMCRTILSLVNISRGFLLGLMICAYSSGILSPTSQIAAMVSAAELVAASIILVFYSSIAEVSSLRFISSAQAENPILLSKPFFSYFLLFMLCFGATLLLRIFSSVILQVLIVI